MQTKTFFKANEVIAELTDLAKNKSLVFRGYGKQSELFPNIMRDNDLRNREIELLVAFEKYGLQYCSVNNSIDFMSNAQHFGLPTRLLDFSFNPFVALYFALYMPKSSKYTVTDDKEYYYIRYCDASEQIVFNTLPAIMSISDEYVKADSFAFQCKKSIETINDIVSSLGEEYSEENNKISRIIMFFSTIYRTTHNQESVTDPKQFRPFINELIQKFEEDRLLLIDADQSSNRIVMQQGLFMFPYNLDKNKHLEILCHNTNLIKSIKMPAMICWIFSRQ